MNLLHLDNTRIGIGSGILGGVGKYLLEIPSHINFGTALYHTIITALISAACGLLVKDAYGWIKRKIKR